MCSLCGILGCDDHWTSAVPRDGVYTRNADRLTRQAEAARRLRLANRVLGLWRMKLALWQGRSYVLSNATGSTRVFDALSHLWPEAETMAGRQLDPLDPVLLARLEADT